jgi:hypothetical protein
MTDGAVEGGERGGVSLVIKSLIVKKSDCNHRNRGVPFPEEVFELSRKLSAV